MRTIRKIVLAIILTMTTFVNFANNKESNIIENVANVSVVFDDAKIGNELIIKDADGTILHSEKINKKGKLVKTFNFSELKDGNYTLELNKDLEILVRFMQIKNNVVVFDLKSEKVIFKPFIRNKENKLMVTKIAFDGKPLRVSIYYNNEIIYSETIKEDTIMNRIYSLDKELKGDYKIVSYSNERTYVNSFKI